MDQLFESGLFLELEEEEVGYDPVLYEDTPKQQDFHTSSFPADVYEDDRADSTGVAVDGFHAEQNHADIGALDCLLAENNQLLDQLISANALSLHDDTSVNLSDIDEVAAQLNDFHDDVDAMELNGELLAGLEQLTSSDYYPLSVSPTPDLYPVSVSPSSSLDTLPSEPSSPIDLTPFVPYAEEQEKLKPTADLTDLLQSLLDENDNMPKTLKDNYMSEALQDESMKEEPETYYDCCMESPTSSEESYSTSYSQATSEDSFLSTSSSGKVKSKKKSKSTPYSKLPAGRKERKKKQNKEAAIRYREKKRKEAQEVLGEEAQLAQRNNELKTEVLNLEREIMCMKELLSDVFNIHSF